MTTTDVLPSLRFSPFLSLSLTLSHTLIRCNRLLDAVLWFMLHCIGLDENRSKCDFPVQDIELATKSVDNVQKYGLLVVCVLNMRQEITNIISNFENSRNDLCVYCWHSQKWNIVFVQ